MRQPFPNFAETSLYLINYEYFIRVVDRSTDNTNTTNSRNIQINDGMHILKFMSYYLLLLRSAKQVFITVQFLFFVLEGTKLYVHQENATRYFVLISQKNMAMHYE